MLIYLNAYLTTRKYGGAEEGGWWYDVGKCVACVPYLIPEELEKEGNEFRADLARNRTEWSRETISTEVAYFIKRRIIDFDRKYESFNSFLDEETKELELKLKDLEWGDPNSVNGGEKIQVYRDMDFGRDFPTFRPHYE